MAVVEQSVAPDASSTTFPESDPLSPDDAAGEMLWPEPEASPVFVVDDDEGVVGSISRYLERAGYPVRGFADPVEAHDALKGGEEVHLLVTDLKMPGMDGISLGREALQTDPNLVVIILTGEGNLTSAVDALRLGLVDYLQKPVDLAVLELAVGRALRTRAQSLYHRRQFGRLRREVEAQKAELEKQQARLQEVTVGSLAAFVRLLEAKSPYFEGHSKAVSELAVAIADHLGLPPRIVDDVKVAGLLHDIGMIAIPDEIIDKSGELESEETRQVKEHTRLAGTLLAPFQHLGKVVDYVIHHHERLDGSGYPDGLSGKEIPVGAQIVGLSDAYVALVESRSFRDAVPPDEAMETLRGAEGTWFAGQLLNALDQVRASVEIEP